VHDRQKLTDELIQNLVRQSKAQEALKLLLESGDLENALMIAQKNRTAMDSVIRQLSEALEIPVPTEPTAYKPVMAQIDKTTPQESVDSSWDSFEKKLESITWASVVNFFKSPLKAGITAAVLLLMSIPPIWRAWMARDHGLSAEYFSDRDLNNLVMTRRHIGVDFRWLRRPPKGMPLADDFSIRFTGSVLAESDGDYEFFTLSDDGVRIWIDDRLLIDNWELWLSIFNFFCFFFFHLK
jgi:hypothetical protein